MSTHELSKGCKVVNCPRLSESEGGIVLREVSEVLPDQLRTGVFQDCNVRFLGGERAWRLPSLQIKVAGPEKEASV